MKNFHQDEIIEFKKFKKSKSNPHKKTFIFKIIGFIMIIFFLIKLSKKFNLYNYKNKNNTQNKIIPNHEEKLKFLSQYEIDYNHNLLQFESNILYLSDINKRRISILEYILFEKSNINLKVFSSSNFFI